MFGGVVRLGHLAGIPFGVHPLWLVIVVLLTTTLGDAYYPSEVDDLSTGGAYALGLASTLTLFAGIVLHELGHAVVARRHGVEIEEIDLWLLGGVARMANEPREARGELRFAIAGPAVTFVLLALFALLRAGLDGVAARWVLAFLDYQLYVNGAILVFNLLPAFPLDGGRVLRAILWGRSGDRDEATARAGAIGAAFGWGFVALGVLGTMAGGNGLMLALVGGFVVVAARSEQQRAILHHDLGDLVAADVMVQRPITVPADLGAEEAVRSIVVQRPFASFPVVDRDGRAVGLLRLQSLRTRSPLARESLTVADLMDHDEGLFVTPDAPLGDFATELPFLRLGRAVVVDPEGRVAGLVSTTDISRRLALTR